jgi:hypothetical protein
MREGEEEGGAWGVWGTGGTRAGLGWAGLGHIAD